MANRPNLTRAELQAANSGKAGDALPTILSPAELAKFLGLPRKTIYLWLSLGRLEGCFRRRGKHVLIWRDRALAKVFDGPDW